MCASDFKRFFPTLAVYDSFDLNMFFLETNFPMFRALLETTGSQLTAIAREQIRFDNLLQYCSVPTTVSYDLSDPVP